MIAIRVLRDRRVVREIVLPALPVTVGRAGENDVVLSDPSVSRTHARIEQADDGHLRLVDLGSRNGLHVAGRPVGEVQVDRCLACRLGRVEIEVEPVSDAPTVEVDVREWRRYERRRAAPRQILSLVVGVAGVAAAELVKPSFGAPWNHARWVSLLGEALGALILLPFVAGVMLVALKAVGRPVRFADTLRVTGGLAWIAPLVSLVLQAAYYPLPPAALQWFRGALAAAVAVVVVVTVATLRRRPPSRRFALAWAGITLLLAAAGAWTQQLQARQSGAPTVDLLVQPPLAGHAGRATSLDEYLAAVREAGEGNVSEKGG